MERYFREKLKVLVLGKLQSVRVTDFGISIYCQERQRLVARNISY